MSFLLADRVQETTSTTGTGTLTLTGAVSQFRTFLSGIGNGNLTYYALLDGNGVAWEVGSGTVGSGTLSRTTILASSNGGSAINLSAFTPHYVYSDAPAAAVQLLASIADGTILANVSGSANPPTASTLTAIIDHDISSTQGVILYRDTSAWLALSPGTSGDFLQTQGASANPQWATAVTSVASGTGLTGGPITQTGTLSLASVSDSQILSNISGSSAAPVPNSLSAIIDHAISSTQGVILYRGGSGWVALATGTSGYFLQTQGASANPQWAAPTYSTLPAEIQNSLAQASVPGLIPISTKVMIIPIVMNMQIPANFAGSAGYSGTNATSSFAFTVSYIHSGSPATIGTFTFSSAGNTPALSTQSAVSLVSGDVVIMTSASVADGTLADVGLTLLLLKQ